MKIFSWIRGFQFPSNAQFCISPNGGNTQDGSRGQTRRCGSPIGKGNGEKEPLLEHYVKFVQCWELEEILTIGTLAIDPLNQNNEMLTQCETELFSLYTDKISDVETKCKQEIDAMNEEIVQEEMIEMEKRITLLDLLLAEKIEVDNVEEENPNVYGNSENEFCKATKTKKKGISYIKLRGGIDWKKGFFLEDNKLAPKDNNSGDKRPLKKLERFVTRMTRKKIHPDMEAGLLKRHKPQGKLNDAVQSTSII